MERKRRIYADLYNHRVRLRGLVSIFGIFCWRFVYIMTVVNLMCGRKRYARNVNKDDATVYYLHRYLCNWMHSMCLMDVYEYIVHRRYQTEFTNIRFVRSFGCNFHRTTCAPSTRTSAGEREQEKCWRARTAFTNIKICCTCRRRIEFNLPKH